jgi:MoaA/NifB/PqqE/SkfB family radical SAM enzyme
LVPGRAGTKHRSPESSCEAFLSHGCSLIPEDYPGTTASYRLRVSRVRGREIRVGFNTNATLLTRRRAEELVASGADWLHVSLDGATSARYEAIREGAHFDTVVANLAGLVAAKQEASSATPWIRVVFVAMRDNVAELPALVRLLAEVGVDELRVQNLSHSFDDTGATPGYAQIREFTAGQALWTGPDVSHARAALAAAMGVARDTGLRLRLPSLTDDGGGGGGNCTWPWDAAYVTSAGVVQPCCMVMGDDRISLGDLMETGFARIWYGAAYRDFRRRLDSADPRTYAAAARSTGTHSDRLTSRPWQPCRASCSGRVAPTPRRAVSRQGPSPRPGPRRRSTRSAAGTGPTARCPGRAR